MFKAFPKIPRLNREIIITEKIDGTNAQVVVWDENKIDPNDISKPYGPPPQEIPWLWKGGNLWVAAGSRTRWVHPSEDNYGFANWVWVHADDLANLGHGVHYGEWWGHKIQRGYGLSERRFSLFNTSRWASIRPGCCHVVPVLYQGPFSKAAVDFIVGHLEGTGSIAAPGFMKPEGVVVYHTAANSLFKVTIEGDDAPKSKS
jgi:hypothetical protein